MRFKSLEEIRQHYGGDLYDLPSSYIIVYNRKTRQWDTWGFKGIDYVQYGSVRYRPRNAHKIREA